MAEKHTDPLSPANVHQRSDAESATLQSSELKRKKRIKCGIYIAVFIVVQIIVITALGLTVMRVKSPKVRLGAISVQNFNAVAATPSFDLSFKTQIRIKNTNFGPYKFDASTVTFEYGYGGETVGQVSIPKSKAGIRSTKKIDVTVSLNSTGLSKNSGLGSDMSTGVVALTSKAKLPGKVELMFVMKKKKSAEMDCRMEFNLSTKEVQFLKCE